MTSYDRYDDDFEHLAARLLDLGDVDRAELEIALADNYNISIEDFEKLSGDLLNFTIPLKNPLSGTHYHAFGYEEGIAWISVLKKPAEP